MFASLPKRMRQDSLKKLIETAKMMHAGKLDLVTGSRDINRLRHYTEYPHDELFNIFIVIAVNSEAISVENREEYLRFMYLFNEMEGKILESCQKLIIKLS